MPRAFAAEPAKRSKQRRTAAAAAVAVQQAVAGRTERRG